MARRKVAAGPRLSARQQRRSRAGQPSPVSRTGGSARGQETIIAMTTPMAFQGAIFDVDGVLVDSPHAQAWQEALYELMEGEW